MEFGIFIPQGWRLDLTEVAPEHHWSTLRELVQYVDAGSTFQSLWVYDHFHTVPEPLPEATHEAWTLMAAFAAVTNRVRLGQMCTCTGYRNPAYLAKVAATTDVISSGRVEMGIGAGWYEHEWRAYGYGFPTAGQRIARLAEGVEIMSQMWRTGSATFEGTHYQVSGALCYPQPLQPGGIPLWIAGGGERKTLRIAAQYADYTNFDGSPEGFAHKSQVLASHCADIGRDFGAIKRSVSYNVVVAETEKEVAAKLAQISERLHRLVPAQAEAEVTSLRESLLTGTPEQLVERLQGMKDLGAAYTICYFPDLATDRSGMELFEASVAPALR